MMRFTIRDLLWLTALVSLAVAWFGVSRISRAKIELLEERALELGDERNLWQFRAEYLEERFTKDGYSVTWKGNWTDHTIDVLPPPSDSAPAIVPNLGSD